jgi:hypothetical protein
MTKKSPVKAGLFEVVKLAFAGSIFNARHLTGYVESILIAEYQ